jgi:L-lactate dehydrogenase complex protein LldG
MTSAREDVFANLRRSLGVRGQELPRRQIVADRLARTPRGVVPERGQVEGEERLALFKRGAEGALATVTLVDRAEDVPGSVAEYLRNHNLPATLRMGDDPRLAALPWSDTALDLAQGASAGGDLNAVGHAFGAVAETGTLVMVSGHENPSTLNFLPDNHIVVLEERDVAGDFETALARVRDAYGKGEMPRTVNFITGPSRSADIEQTLLIGAHGPRRLHIVVVRS